MSFDPRCFLNLSYQLSDDITYDEESKYRTSISRAYYAAFLISRTYLESEDFTLSSTRSVHQEIIEYMKDVNYLVSNLLIKLRKNRTDADYNLTMLVKKGITNSSIRCAQQIIDEVNNM